jgi:hypothetical protein
MQPSEATHLLGAHRRHRRPGRQRVCCRDAGSRRARRRLCFAFALRFGHRCRSIERLLLRALTAGDGLGKLVVVHEQRQDLVRLDDLADGLLADDDVLDLQSGRAVVVSAVPDRAGRK